LKVFTILGRIHFCFVAAKTPGVHPLPHGRYLNQRSIRKRRGAGAVREDDDALLNSPPARSLAHLRRTVE
jgi:hypothetical protein